MLFPRLIDRFARAALLQLALPPVVLVTGPRLVARLATPETQQIRPGVPRLDDIPVVRSPLRITVDVDDAADPGKVPSVGDHFGA